MSFTAGKLLYHYIIILHQFHIACVLSANIVPNILDFTTPTWMIYSFDILEFKTILEVTLDSFSR